MGKSYLNTYSIFFTFVFQMNQHIEADGDCPLAVVLCRYNDIGCKHKVCHHGIGTIQMYIKVLVISSRKLGNIANIFLCFVYAEKFSRPV